MPSPVQSRRRAPTVEAAPVVGFDTHPDRYHHWRLAVDDEVATVTLEVDEAERSGARLRAQAELLRPGGRHRAVRRRTTTAVRASGGEGRRDDGRPGPDVLRRCEHPDARAVEPRVEGELLQVHQRDPQRHRGRDRELRSDLDRGPQRHRRRRRLRARPRLRRHRPHRRRLLHRLPARGTPVGRPARHRWPHPRGRQAPRPQGPGRPVRHQVRGLPRQHGCRLGPDRRHLPPAGVGRADRRARVGRRRSLLAQRRARRRADPARPGRGRRHDHLPPCHRRHRTGRAPGGHHGARADRGAACRCGGRARAGSRTTGRWRSRARSTTWSSGCAPTSRSSAPGSSAARETSTRCSPTTPSCANWPTTGSSTRPSTSTSACSSGSTSPAAACSR